MQKILLLLLLSFSTLLSSELGTIYGLDPNGDGFLSIRKKPKSTEIGRLYNGDKVKILDRSGKWYKIKDIRSNRVGWSHSNWIKTRGNSSSKKSSTSSSRQSYSKPQRQTSDPYYVGACVSKKGRMAIFLKVTIKGYIEAKGGNNQIKIRIADTEGQTPHYNGVSLYQNTIIWDNKYNWKLCR